MHATEQTQNGRKFTLRKRLLRLLISIGRIYLVVLLALMLLENKLVFPAPRYPTGDWQPAGFQYEDVYFTSADGTKLHGWYLDCPSPIAHVLFCHGNGENIAYLARFADFLRTEFQVAVFTFDYRGYGRSDGSANEAGILEDGRAAHAWLAERIGAAPDQIVLMGRSLGGAVAVDLAVADGARGLILESTFPSLPDVASRLYWWAPIRLMMRTRLNSVEKIRSLTCPLLQSHGTADKLIPISLGRRLFHAAPSGNKQFVELPGLGHNKAATPHYYDELTAFLRKLPECPANDSDRAHKIDAGFGAEK